MDGVDDFEVPDDDTVEELEEYRRRLDQQIEENDPDKLFLAMLLAGFFDLIDLPLEIIDTLPFVGAILTGSLTFSEGFGLWLALLGKGGFLRLRMRIWLWVWTFFEAIIPFAGIIPTRYMLIAYYSRQLKKKQRVLIIERERVIEKLKTMQ